MEIKKLFKSLSKLEIVLLIILIIYVVLPIDTPKNMVDYVESPLGMLVIFITTVYLFFHANSIIAVIYILVAYELLRRSSQSSGKVLLKEYKPKMTSMTNSTSIPLPNPMPTKKTVTFSNTPKIEHMQNLEPISISDENNTIINKDKKNGNDDELEIEIIKNMMPIQNIPDSNNTNYMKSDFQPVLDKVNGGSLF
jgi:hypothetical protein